MWQLIDSAFPIGGFAHSAGLEAAFQMGAVGTTESLDRFLRISMGQAVNFSAPFVAHVARSPADAKAADHLYHCQTTNPISNSASRVQGNALLSTATEAFSLPQLQSAREAIRMNELFGHFPVVFGFVMNLLNYSDEQAVDAFLFCQLRGWMSAAVRLGIIGPRQAQSMQNEMARHREIGVKTALSLSLDECGQSSPLLEVTQGLHGRLYSRLFVS